MGDDQFRKRARLLADAFFECKSLKAKYIKWIYKNNIDFVAQHFGVPIGVLNEYELMGKVNALSVEELDAKVDIKQFKSCTEHKRFMKAILYFCKRFLPSDMKVIPFDLDQEGIMRWPTNVRIKTLLAGRPGGGRGGKFLTKINETNVWGNLNCGGSGSGTGGLQMQ